MIKRIIRAILPLVKLYIFNIFGHINSGDIMQKILITGARSGMIYPVIQKLKDDYVYVSVHTESELKRVSKLYEKNSNIHCLKLDIVKDADKLEDLDIDVLVLNGAVAESGSLLEIPLEKVKENFEVNVFSNLNLIQKVVNNMIYKGFGRIVIISSLTSKMALPFLGSYCSTKAALSVMARCLHYECMLLRSNIEIVLVEPGLYKTGFNKLTFDKKYEFMDNNSFFESQIDLIRKSENIYLKLFEKRNLNSISNKIYKAITCKNPKFRYSAPLSHNLFAKIINIFY